MSKTEELLNALLTDAEVDNFVPSSRFEEILLCCIKKEGPDKCGNPQSRGELLLQKLAEKIEQSGESSGLVDISTADEMTALLTAENVGKIYRFTGTTDGTYTNGDLYEVVSE